MARYFRLKHVKEQFKLTEFSGSMAKLQETKLQENLPRLNSEDELKRWMTGRLVKPYWDRLYNESLKPKYDAIEVGDKNSRGSDFARIIRRLIAGEANGRRKFSDEFSVTTGWTENDHMALFILTTVQVNSADRDGLWFRSDADTVVKQWGMYQVLKYFKSFLAGSKRGKGKDLLLDQPIPGPATDTETEEERAAREAEELAVQAQLDAIDAAISAA